MSEYQLEFTWRSKCNTDALVSAIAEYYPQALKADGFDTCIIGYTTEGRIVYSIDMILATLVDKQGMTADESVEFFEFNIACAYMGDYTPIYMYTE